MLADDPAALGDAVRDPADDRRRPDARSRATAARCSTSPNRLYPIVRDSTAAAAGAELGGVLAMRRIAALLALAALAACGSGGTDPIVAGGLDEVQRLLDRRGRRDAGGAPPRAAHPGGHRARRTSRRSGRGSSPTRRRRCCTRRRRTARYVTYLLAAAAVDHAARLAGHRRPAASAPTCCRPGAARRTRWRGRRRRRAGRRGSSAPTSSRPTGRAGRIETYQCRFERGAGARDGDPAACATAASRSARPAPARPGRFENLHFADAGSGFVWRSLQWIGPKMDLARPAGARAATPATDAVRPSCRAADGRVVDSPSAATAPKRKGSADATLPQSIRERAQPRRRGSGSDDQSSSRRWCRRRRRRRRSRSRRRSRRGRCTGMIQAAFEPPIGAGSATTTGSSGASKTRVPAKAWPASTRATAVLTISFIVILLRECGSAILLARPDLRADKLMPRTLTNFPSCIQSAKAAPSSKSQVLSKWQHR